jgi:integrase
VTMVYQKGTVYLQGAREKKWYGKFRVYMRDRDGRETERTRKVVLGLKSELRKWEAEKKLQEVILKENGNGNADRLVISDDTVTFGWFVAERYLPMRRGRWRPPTREKTEFEISKYLVAKFSGVPLRRITAFEMQMVLNNLAERYSESIVKHAYVNLRSIMRVAHKLKFVSENPGEDLSMPETKTVHRPTMNTEQVAKLIDAIEDPHDLCLMGIALFCATRTSETFGLQWKSYAGDRLVVHGTAYAGRLYEGKVKTDASSEAIPIPEDVRPLIEAWRRICKDTSPEALMFPTFGRGSRTGEQVPRNAKNFLRWRIHPIAQRLGIPRKLVTFQVMRRTLGTDLQQHGSMKDAQRILRHASIRTTANIYMQPIPASVVAAINSRTRAIFRSRSGENSFKVPHTTVPNGSKLKDEVLASA